MFNKKLKLEIVELEERILQLEKRLESYRRENRALNTMVKNLNDEMIKNYIDIQKQLKKRSDKE